MQDTFVRALQSLPTFRGEAPVWRWLVTITRRACAQEIARRQDRRQMTTRLDSIRVEPVAGPATVVELADALRRLPRQRLEAFLLTSVAGLSYAEAADVCECPVGTIRSRVSRARTDLQEMLFPPDAAHRRAIS